MLPAVNKELKITTVNNNNDANNTYHLVNVPTCQAMNAFTHVITFNLPNNSVR
jgi:hypothetical protein